MAGDRAEVAALARVGLLVLDDLAARGLETSEVPRDWLNAALRWGRWEAKPHEINPYSRALNTIPRRWWDDYLRLTVTICEHIRDVRTGRWGNYRDLALAACASALKRGTGEDYVAARHRVTVAFQQFHREEAVIDAAHLFAK